MKIFSRSTYLITVLFHYAIGFSLLNTNNNVVPLPKSIQSTTRTTNHDIHPTKIYTENNTQDNQQRRTFIRNSISFMTVALGSSLPANAVERAVGSSEMSCRAEGNCLEKFELDGAVGWSWGGKDRCDATDPRCGPDGSLKDAPPSGQPIPKQIDDNGNELKITNIVNIDMSIGRSEQGTLTIGLYGNTCPNSVAQMLDFFSENIYSGGILTTSKLMLEDGLGVQTTPVSFIKGGNLQLIYPENRLDFGIASQAVSYARAKRLSKAPESFVPQPRPNKEGITEENTARSHNVAGLLSIPKNGLGYGGSGLESEDEAFASAFEITANNVPAMDKENRKVIGQLMDETSMQFLQRLVSLPTNKGLKGVIPGQNAGPPLIKVSVTSVSVSNL